MVTTFRLYAALLLFLVSDFQITSVLGDTLPVQLMLVNLVDNQYLSSFNVGGCQYYSSVFNATSEGGIPDGIPPSTHKCDKVPNGAPKDMYLASSDDLLQPSYYTSDTSSHRACSLQEAIANGPTTFTCDPMGPDNTTGTTATSNTTTNDATATTTDATANSTTTTTTDPNATTDTTATNTVATVTAATLTAATIDTSATTTTATTTDPNATTDTTATNTVATVTATTVTATTISITAASATTVTDIATTTTSSIGSTPSSSTAPTDSGSCVNNNNVFGQKEGNGILNDCCSSNADCTGSCIKGKCDADGNPPSGKKCEDKSYYGKKNGKGPAGVCCITQWDCKNSCVNKICID